MLHLLPTPCALKQAVEVTYVLPATMTVPVAMFRATQIKMTVMPATRRKRSPLRPVNYFITVLIFNCSLTLHVRHRLNAVTMISN